jgi:hypothetical protein
MMKNKLLLPVVVALLACGLCTAPTFADINLWDWALNIDGALTLPGDALPSTVDASGFDFNTGLGTLSVTATAPGNHFVGLFVDHELSEATNTFYNESGATSGTPLAGQTWEIDEPGYVFGDIYDNVIASSLDGSNGVPAGSEDDVSMAMGWDITVAAGIESIVTFDLSTVAPFGGFYLVHQDPDSGEKVYFSGDVQVVPLPSAVLLGSLGLGVAGRLVGRFNRRKTR